MKTKLLGGVFGALIVLGSCRVDLGDQLKYLCTSDADCGDGWKCTTASATHACCKPSGEDVCDGADNDCDGLVDNSGKSEACNNQDDDCDGQIDEGFDLYFDRYNCGTCAHACASTEVCALGNCAIRKEADCTDGLDNDNNGQTDCADTTCDQIACATGCVCAALAKKEIACSDGNDNDTDSSTDCADTDCNNQSCGTGCSCVAGVKKETNCYDNVDNDGDSSKDCLDSDCLGQACSAPPLFFTCTVATTCNCNGGAQIAESNARCRDGIDNDCNGKMDCAESSCDGKSCIPDGGTACVCASLVKKEGDCTNGLDDDGDTSADCADSDCPAGTPCVSDGGTAMCNAGACN